MPRFYAFLLILLCNSVSCLSFAQINKDSLINNYSRFVRENSPEKLFLHTDKSHYVAGEYIWFKGYLQNSSIASVQEESSFIYAELYGDTLISRVKIKKEDDGFAGRVPIGHNIPSGKYTLRAYTQWMMNSLPDYMFNKEISVINPAFKDSARIDIEEGLINRVASLQFFPESGRIISQKFARIAFKATDNRGRGIAFSGKLFNSKDSLISEVIAEHNGMGEIRFYAAPDERYYVITKGNNGENIRYDLPKSEKSGAVINIQKRDNKLFINTILTEDLLTPGAFIIAHDGDAIFLYEELFREDRVFVVNEKSLSAGINHFIITDSSANILAERLIFKFPENLIKTEVTPDKPSEELEKRERTQIKICITDSIGNPVKGEFSVSVTDSFLAPAEPYVDNIKSFIYLTSELKGTIENPAWYFDEKNINRERAMDLLMMVHGWRYYNLQTIFKSYTNVHQKKESERSHFQREYTQAVSGRATSNFRNTKRAILSVLAPEIDLAVSEYLNKTGHFIVSELDFPDSTGFIISCTGKEGQKGYYLQVDKQTFPALTYYPFNNDLTIKRDYSKDESYSRIFEQSGGYGAVMLMAATVTSTKKVAAKHNPSPFNQTFERRQIRERGELDMYAGWSLFDYVLGTFPGLMNGGTAEDGSRLLVSTRSSTITGEKEEPHVYINRMRVQSSGDLDKYLVDDVENVAYLRGNEGFLYRTLSGVVLVTLRYSVSSLAKSPFTYYNTIFERPLGWQKPSRFYSPDYSLDADNNAVSYDTRTTLFWSPVVKTNDNGEAVISYYSSDRKTRHNISVEGITADGHFFSTFK